MDPKQHWGSITLGVYSLGLPISDLEKYILGVYDSAGLHSGGLHSGGLHSGGLHSGVYTLGVYSLGLPILDLAEHTLGVYTVGVYSLQPRATDFGSGGAHACP